MEWLLSHDKSTDPWLRSESSSAACYLGDLLDLAVRVKATHFQAHNQSSYQMDADE
jgi:hypothetical protein